MAGSSSDGVAVIYILPVLWMTSYFPAGPYGAVTQECIKLKVTYQQG